MDLLRGPEERSNKSTVESDDTILGASDEKDDHAQSCLDRVHRQEGKVVGAWPTAGLEKHIDN